MDSGEMRSRGTQLSSLAFRHVGPPPVHGSRCLTENHKSSPSFSRDLQLIPGFEGLLWKPFLSPLTPEKISQWQQDRNAATARRDPHNTCAPFLLVGSSKMVFLLAEPSPSCFSCATIEVRAWHPPSPTQSEDLSTEIESYARFGGEKNCLPQGLSLRIFLKSSAFRSLVASKLFIMHRLNFFQNVASHCDTKKTLAKPALSLVVALRVRLGPLQLFVIAVFASPW